MPKYINKDVTRFISYDPCKLVIIVPLGKNNTDADTIYAVLDLLYRIKISFLNHLLQINQFPLGINAVWKTAAQYDLPDQHLADWLLHTGSLTERLQAHTNSFEVKVLGQATLDAEQSEIDALADYHKHNWQIREVILYGNGKPWVFARSVLPEHLCNTTWSTLGNQPLGQRIFNDDNFVRSEFVIAQLNENPIASLDIIGSDESVLKDIKARGSYSAQANSALIPSTKISSSGLWGRRSAFQILDWHLLVAEIFLPDCPSYVVNPQSEKSKNETRELK
ncbi:MAG: chorismate--pyruvate lyase [Glaciecola sp.]|jgi:chorismate--pyruvate lyase